MQSSGSFPVFQGTIHPLRHACTIMRKSASIFRPTVSLLLQISCTSNSVNAAKEHKVNSYKLHLTVGPPEKNLIASIMEHRPLRKPQFSHSKISGCRSISASQEILFKILRISIACSLIGMRTKAHPEKSPPGHKPTALYIHIIETSWHCA